jgi:hypothetical protein
LANRRDIYEELEEKVFIMTQHTANLEPFAIPLPITQSALHLAEQFSQRQPTPRKAEQVRLNTLAVCVVNDYLQMMGIATDVSASESWNPVVQLSADVADLEVAGLGRLECRPVLEPARREQPTCPIPPEVWEDRIGYVVVEIDEATREANLLGFVEQTRQEELRLSDLRSPEDLLDHLDRLLHPAAAQVTMASQVARRSLVNLSQWLQNSFETGWQTVESLLNPPEMNLAYGFRGMGIPSGLSDQSAEGVVRRAKLIDLNIQMPSPVALIVELVPEAAQRTDIRLQVHPTGNQIYLPENLRLEVLDQAGDPFLEAQSRGVDNYIQLQFSGVPGESFQVRVAIADASVVEHFVI